MVAQEGQVNFFIVRSFISMANVIIILINVMRTVVGSGGREGRRGKGHLTSTDLSDLRYAVGRRGKEGKAREGQLDLNRPSPTLSAVAGGGERRTVIGSEGKEESRANGNRTLLT